MDWDFIHEDIDVEFVKKPGPPASFTWRGEKHTIAEVLRGWSDHGFGALGYRPRWWQRRHRNCYRAKTSAGDLVEFYLDRAAGKWILYRRQRARDPRPASDQ